MRGLELHKYRVFSRRLLLLVVASGLIVVFYLQAIVFAGVVLWPGSGTSTDISTGDAHSCAVADGKAYCWGSGAAGRLGQGTTASSSIPVAVSTSDVLSGKTVTSVSTGDAHSCAVADGKAYCWGSGAAGRLGQGTTASSSIPVAVSTTGVLNGKTVTRISASVDFTCAVASGAAYCWGYGGNGELGNGGTSSSSFPVAVTMSGVLSGKTVTEISSGDSHTCVVASGQAYCWGVGEFGQLGHNSSGDSTVPVAVTGTGVLSGKTVTEVTTASEHSCAVASGAAYCWGSGAAGRLGRGSTTSSNVPVAVSTSGVLNGKTVTRISALVDFTCAVASGAAYCWGYGGNGELGNGGTSNSLSPVAVTMNGVLNGKTVTEISSGDSHSCVTASGQAYCWGVGTNGRLGNNATGNSPAPVAVVSQGDFMGSAYRFYTRAASLQPGMSLADISQPATIVPGIGSGDGASMVSGGDAHTCAAAQGKAYCWGYGADGELGNNSTGNSLVPVAVIDTGALSGKTVTQVAAGYGHSCAVASGAAYCWGYNNKGQLGNNSTDNTLVPVAVTASGVLSGKTVTAISTGFDSTCAIADGAAYCWGDNDYGQLGGGTGDSLMPRAVDVSGVLSGKTITKISVGDSLACAVASGAAYCWGYNTSGQVGNGTNVHQSAPRAVNTSGVLGGKTVTDITVGINHTCAVATGKAYCWGINNTGQLGTGATSVPSNVPVAVNTTGVLNGKTVTQVSAGEAHSCVLASGALFCWGDNGTGQLGHGTTGSSLLPIAVDVSQVLAGLTPSWLEVGRFFGCGVASGNVYCWGEGLDGQLGRGSTPNSFTPVRATLPQAPINLATTFRLRVGVGAASATMPAGVNSFSLQYAQRTAATCSVQATGFTAVSTTGDIRWHAQSGLTSGSAIAALANDPLPSGSNNPQHYLHVGSTFSNAIAIDSGKSGLWDFSLRNTSPTNGVVYCFRITYADGTPLEQYASYPQVNIGNTGPSLSFVDVGGSSVAAPSFPMANRLISASCQTSTTTIGSSGGTRLRAAQGNTPGGWSISIAPTNGATSVWTRADGMAHYDFNDPSGSPAGCNSGSDGDGLAGQMSLALNTTNLAPMSDCTNSGMSWSGSPTVFSSTVGAITLVSAPSSSQVDCYWDIYDTQLSQTIPPLQQPGNYEINLTTTVVAQ